MRHVPAMPIKKKPIGHLPPPKTPARILCIASGKGGTGKSILTSNLGVFFASRNKKVAIVDADMGLANQHLLLGIKPALDISHIVHSGKSLKDVAVTGPKGIWLIPGGSGIPDLSDVNPYELDLILGELRKLEKSVDLILIDTAAGISPQTMIFLYAAPEVLLVTTPDITAITDAYALIKTLAVNTPDTRIILVVNRVAALHEAKAVYGRIAKVARKFLNKNILFGGYIFDDPSITQSIFLKSPVVVSNPDSISARCIQRMALHLENSKHPEPSSNSFFMRVRRFVP